MISVIAVDESYIATRGCSSDINPISESAGTDLEVKGSISTNFYLLTQLRLLIPSHGVVTQPKRAWRDLEMYAATSANSDFTMNTVKLIHNLM